MQNKHQTLTEPLNASVPEPGNVNLRKRKHLQFRDELGTSPTFLVPQLQLNATES